MCHRVGGVIYVVVLTHGGTQRKIACCDTKYRMVPYTRPRQGMQKSTGNIIWNCLYLWIVLRGEQNWLRKGGWRNVRRAVKLSERDLTPLCGHRVYNRKMFIHIGVLVVIVCVMQGVVCVLM